VSSSAAAAGLRAEVAGVLRGVDAVGVALTTTIEATARESADQVRAVLVAGLRDLGMQFAEFGWLLGEVNSQITVIAETHTEIAAGSRAMLEAQQRTLVQLAMLRRQARPVQGAAAGGAPGPLACRLMRRTQPRWRQPGFLQLLSALTRGWRRSGRRTRTGSSAVSG
jgi:hypothetical protein